MNERTNKRQAEQDVAIEFQDDEDGDEAVSPSVWQSAARIEDQRFIAATTQSASQDKGQDRATDELE